MQYMVEIMMHVGVRRYKIVQKALLVCMGAWIMLRIFRECVFMHAHKAFTFNTSSHP